MSNLQSIEIPDLGSTREYTIVRNKAHTYPHKDVGEIAYQIFPKSDSKVYKEPSLIAKRITKSKRGLAVGIGLALSIILSIIITTIIFGAPVQGFQLFGTRYVVGVILWFVILAKILGIVDQFIEYSVFEISNNVNGKTHTFSLVNVRRSKYLVKNRTVEMILNFEYKRPHYTRRMVPPSNSNKDIINITTSNNQNQINGMFKQVGNQEGEEVEFYNNTNHLFTVSSPLRTPNNHFISRWRTEKEIKFVDTMFPNEFRLNIEHDTPNSFIYILYSLITVLSYWSYNRIIPDGGGG